MLNRIRVRKATPVKGKFLLLLSFFFFISWWVCKKRSAEIGTPVPVCRCGDWWWWWRCDLFWSFFTSKCVISFYHQSQPIMSLKLIWEKKKKKKWSWEMFIWWSELLYVNIISPRFWAQDLACLLRYLGIWPYRCLLTVLSRRSEREKQEMDWERSL